MKSVLVRITITVLLLVSTHRHAHAQSQPYLTKEKKVALDRVIVKLKNSSEPKDRSLAELLEAAKIDIDSGPERLGQAKTKLFAAALLYEENVRQQIKGTRKVYHEFFFNLGGQANEALVVSYEAMESDWFRASVNQLAHGLYSRDRNEMLERASEKADETMQRLSTFMKTASPEQIVNVRKDLDLLMVHWQDLIIAVGQRMSTAEKRASLFELCVNRLMRGDRFFKKGTGFAIQDLIKIEAGEQISQIYISKETVTAAIYAASMLVGVGEIALAANATKAVVGVVATQTARQVATRSITREIFKKGTVAVAKKGAAGIHGIARGTMLATSTENIIRNIGDMRKNGFNTQGGLSLVIDSLCVLAMLPRPVQSALTARSSAELYKHTQIASGGARLPLFQHLWIYGKASVLKGTVSLQHQAGYAVAGFGIGFGLVQVTMAEALAKDASFNGNGTTVEEVKRQGYANILMGMFGGFNSYIQYKQWAAKSPVFVEMLSETRSAAVWGRMKNNLGQLWIFHPIRDFFRNFEKLATGTRTKAETADRTKKNAEKPFLEKEMPIKSPKTPSAKVHFEGLLHMTGNVARAWYDWALYKALTFYFFTHIDSIPILGRGYEDESAPLPGLRPGEIALGLTSFKSADLLYGSSRTPYALRRERNAYQLGIDYFEDTFNTPEELLYKLELYGKKYGKIRYLKIRAHGIPGAMATSALNIDASGATGIIDAKWMHANAKEIRAISQVAFAEDIHVRLWSCMVGANPNQIISLGNHPATKDPKTGLVTPAVNGITLKPGAGDEFVKAFGSLFMHKGGVLDTSRRSILGIDAAFGQGIWKVIIDSVRKNPKAKKEYDESVDKEIRYLMNSDADPNLAQNYEYLSGIFDKFQKTLDKLGEIIQKYGIQIEGFDKNIFFGAHRQNKMNHLGLNLNVTGNEPFWRVKPLSSEALKKLFTAAEWAAEVLKMPEIISDLTKMAETNDLLETQFLGSRMALTYNLKDKSPFILLNPSTIAGLSESVVRVGKTEKAKQISKSVEFHNSVELASTVAHEWLHTKQDFDYIIKNPPRVYEGEAYTLELRFLEKLLSKTEIANDNLKKTHIQGLIDVVDSHLVELGIKPPPSE